MIILKDGLIKMNVVDEDYYVNVEELMDLPEPKCRHQRPNRKRLMTGDGEYLPIITVETEV